MISSSSNTNFYFVGGKKTGLEDVERENAAIRVTSKPKETTRVNYREADKDHARKIRILGGFRAQRSGFQRQAGKEMRQIKPGP
jgi:hypothetical protein